MLVEKGEIVCKGKNAAEFMKNYFINIKKALNLKSSKNSNNNDIIELIFQFNDHMRIKKTKHCEKYRKYHKYLSAKFPHQEIR